MQRFYFLFPVLVLTLAFLLVGTIYAASNEDNRPPWKKEFDEICAKVQVGNDLKKEELEELVKRADTLMEDIKKLDIPSKKVYIFRLKKCKKFFQYIIELKESEKSSWFKVINPLLVFS
ncbi:MAG: hypothetical protein D6726_05625 [Nitrospirae bacterium]|nr:MAG: hypothetical protein D6726_05625 [Nitrospirota bacterium]